MAHIRSGRCEFCGNPAVAFQRGSLVCGQCGTKRTLGEAPNTGRLQRRGTIFGVISTGLMVKMVIGTAALAAVGSYTAASVLPTSSSPDATPTTIAAVMASPDLTTAVPVIEDPAPVSDDPAPLSITPDQVAELVEEAQHQAEVAFEIAAQARAWADCLSTYAKEHRGSGVDPFAVCGEKPSPSDSTKDEKPSSPSDDHRPDKEEDKTNNGRGDQERSEKAAADKDKDKDKEVDEDDG